MRGKSDGERIFDAFVAIGTTVFWAFVFKDIHNAFLLSAWTFAVLAYVRA